jgi:hypothetical protein
MASEFCYNQGVIHLIITSMYSMRYFNYLTIHTTRLLSRVWENTCLFLILTLTMYPSYSITSSLSATYCAISLGLISRSESASGISKAGIIVKKNI